MSDLVRNPLNPLRPVFLYRGSYQPFADLHISISVTFIRDLSVTVWHHPNKDVGSN